MTTMTVVTDSPAPDLARAAGRRARHRRRTPLQLLLHVVLALAAVLSVAGAAVVVVERLGFSPVLTSSMLPTYAPGTLLVTHPVATSSLRVGQVYVLPLPDAPGQRYVHRVISVKDSPQGPVVRTKGDNNPAADDWQLTITSAKVPHVVASAPSVGSLALLMDGSALRIPLLLVIAGCLLVAVKRALLDER